MKKIKMKTDSTFKLKKINVNLSIKSSIILSVWNLVHDSANCSVVNLVDDLISDSTSDLVHDSIHCSVIILVDDFFQTNSKERSE